VSVSYGVNVLSASPDVLDLTPAQVRQADRQLRSAVESVKSRIPEVYQWLLVPAQPDPKNPIEWNMVRLLGNEPIAVRAAEKLLKSEGMIDALGSTILRHHLDAVPLWREGHVSVKSLVNYFASYPYLPRLTNTDVLLNTITSGTTVANYSETYATADSWDATKNSYSGLRTTAIIRPTAYAELLLVQPARAAEQLSRVAPPITDLPPIEGTDDKGEIQPDQDGGTTGSDEKPIIVPPVVVSQVKKYRRYHGTKKLDIQRVSRDANQVIDEVIRHMTEKYGVTVQVTIEISAEFPDGADDTMRRIINENCRQLSFDQFGFEEQ
jgi:hypothetical protein